MITLMFSYEPKSGESIFDSNPRRELERDFLLDATTLQELRTMLTIKPKVIEVSLEPHEARALGCRVDMGTVGSARLSPEFSHLLTGLVSQLREYRNDLNRAVHSISSDLTGLDLALFSPSSDSLLVAQVKSRPEPGTYESQLKAYVFSSHLPCAQTEYYECVQDELLNYEAGRVCWTRAFLRKALTGVKQALHLVSANLTVIQATIIPALFCSVRWEERRWFLFHGARPPRANIQATSGLFVRACSWSLIAS